MWCIDLRDADVNFQNQSVAGVNFTFARAT